MYNAYGFSTNASDWGSCATCGRRAELSTETRGATATFYCRECFTLLQVGKVSDALTKLKTETNLGGTDGQR